MKLKTLARARRQVAHHATCLSFLTLVGCGSFELPTPPDMSALVEDYQNPDGALDGSNAMQLGAEIGTSVEELRGRAPTELLTQLVYYLQKVGGGSGDPSKPPAGSLDDTTDMAGEQTVSGNKIDIGASIKLHHICRGWQEPRKVDAANGSLEMNVALDRQGLLPVVWGYLDHCRLIRNGVSVELTGDLRVRFGTTQSRIGLQLLSQIGYIVELDGSVKAMKGDQEIDTDTHLTFRVFVDGRVHMKIDMPDGRNVVVALDPLALGSAAGPMLEAGLLTRNVSWACTLDLLDVKGSCADGADASSVIKW
jgi:hypothetical protein